MPLAERHRPTAIVLSVLWVFYGLSIHGGLPPVAQAQIEEKPKTNFVVIMADDMGYEGLGCFGSEHFKTPHLDRLASEGMRLTDFHSSGPVCSPTRAGLVTGRYQQRTGIEGVVNADPEHPSHQLGLPLGEVTFAEVLRKVGYATGLFGKWHLGYDPKYNPVHQGFDRFRGFVSGNVDYQSHYDRMGVHDWWDGVTRIREPGYSTRLITDHAVEFIRSNRDRPFCVYVAHEAIHNPNQGPDDPPVRGPDARPESELSPTFEAVRAMTTEMDISVGRIMATLDELGLRERTFVLFFSDNGGTHENKSTGPELRGMKGSLYEGGHRVPAIVRWPGRIAAGQSSDALTISLDVFPTLVDLAGAPMPDDRVIDGQSMAELLTQRGGDRTRTQARQLFWGFGGRFAMREGQWKLVEPRNERPAELYLLSEDLGETNNLADKHPERVRSMKAALAAWRTETQAQPPSP